MLSVKAYHKQCERGWSSRPVTSNVKCALSASVRRPILSKFGSPSVLQSVSESFSV